MSRINRTQLGPLALWSGSSETGTYASGGTLQSDTWYPTCDGGADGVAFKVKVSSNCDVKLYEFDANGVGQLVYTEAVTAADGRKAIDYRTPFSGGYLTITNTDATGGTATAEVQERE